MNGFLGRKYGGAFFSGYRESFHSYYPCFITRKAISSLIFEDLLTPIKFTKLNICGNWGLWFSRWSNKNDYCNILSLLKQSEIVIDLNNDDSLPIQTIRFDGHKIWISFIFRDISLQNMLCMNSIIQKSDKAVRKEK